MKGIEQRRSILHMTSSPWVEIGFFRLDAPPDEADRADFEHRRCTAVYHGAIDIGGHGCSDLQTPDRESVYTDPLHVD
jgi:hypothetical protein